MVVWIDSLNDDEFYFVNNKTDNKKDTTIIPEFPDFEIVVIEKDETNDKHENNEEIEEEDENDNDSIVVWPSPEDEF